MPGLQARHGESGQFRRPGIGCEDLRRSDAAQFCGQKLRRNFGDAQFAAGQVEPGEAYRGTFRGQGEQDIVCFVIKQGRVGERAGRDDTRYAPLDRAF